MRPREGVTMPNTVRSSVDFPAPLAPMIETISPARTSAETPRSTSISPYPACTSSSSSRISPGPSAAKVRLHDLRIPADDLGRALRDLLPVVEHDHARGVVHPHAHVGHPQQPLLALPVDRPDLGLHLLD